MKDTKGGGFDAAAHSGCSGGLEEAEEASTARQHGRGGGEAAIPPGRCVSASIEGTGRRRRRRGSSWTARAGLRWTLAAQAAATRPRRLRAEELGEGGERAGGTEAGPVDGGDKGVLFPQSVVAGDSAEGQGAGGRGALAP